MMRNRYDETWHRLREWTRGQAPSERLAAQVLLRDGYSSIDPSHPLGGPDGGKDAIAIKGNVRFAMAVYFPRGQKTFGVIKKKFHKDLNASSTLAVQGLVFVTNQELTVGKREELRALSKVFVIDIYHLDRVTTIIDAFDMANVRRQFLDIDDDSEWPINFGGTGGSAPSAGGGGGAAIGPSATGGAGGAGGNLTSFEGLPGTAPGAGGGGAGGIGQGAGGGDGGEHVIAMLGPDDLRGIDHVEIQVGKGGQGPGEDTIMNLVDAEGRVLRQIRARGGDQGASINQTQVHRAPSEADLVSGLRVNSVFAAEYIRCRFGLWTFLEAGWDFIQAPTVPYRLAVPLFVELSTGSIEPQTVLEFTFSVRKPSGLQVSESSLLAPIEDSPVHRTRIAKVLELSGTEEGVWTIEIKGGSHVLMEFPLEVRLPAATAT